MKGIYFRSDKELIYFCEIIFQKYSEINVHWRRSKYWGNELKLKNNSLNMEQIITCFTDVFLHLRLDQLIKNIARKVYYYSDDAEIEQICHITKGLLSESSFIKSLFGQDGSLNHYITGLFRNYIHRSENIHFDALITFSIRHLENYLEIVVGYGIDELKREEDHLNYLESVRHYLNRKQFQVEVIHILQGKSPIYYKSDGVMYSRLELKEFMIKEPLYIIGLDENEWHLAPLIALNPKIIYIYGNDFKDAKTTTLKRVFEERVEFMSYDTFPFMK